MKNVFASIFVLSVFYFVLAFSASADTVCQPIYGGGQTCVQQGKIVINKTVQNPSNGAFVDNLGVNDPKHSPDQTVTFQLTVTNTGDTTLSKITVKDIFPQFVSFVSGPGNFDSNTKVLTFDVANLATNESRTFTITGKVAGSGDLPSDQGITCVVNQSTAVSDSQTSQDNAQFCIQKQVLGAAPTVSVPTTTKGGLKVFPAPQVTTTPPTGPEMLSLIGLIPTGALGFFLRKKAIKS